MFNIIESLNANQDRCIFLDRLLKDSNRKPILATANRCLLRKRDVNTSNNDSCTITLHSLSPSDTSCLIATKEFDQLLPSVRSAKARVKEIRPNQTSVVLLLQVNSIAVLLGADIESTGNHDTGWEALLANQTILEEKALLYKIAHHGSRSGHNDQVWQDLCQPNPVAITSPFNNGDIHLPTPADIERIKSYTPHAYITSPIASTRFHHDNRLVEEMTKEIAETIHFSEKAIGNIRFRIHSSASNIDQSKIHLSGHAKAL